MKPNWFIAFPVRAEGWYDAWLDDPPEHTRTFHPDDLHLTLAFLGGVEPEVAHATWRALGEDHALPPATEVNFGGVEPFGNPRKPSAFALTPALGAETLVAAMRRLTNPLLEVAGRRPERRSPRPHVTVLRPHRKAKADARQAILTWAEGKTPPDVRLTLDRLALYTWSDDRKARKFKVVEDIALPG